MFTDFFIKTSTFATALQPEFIINLINVTIMKKILLTLLLMMAAMAASAFDQGDFQYVVTSDSTVTLNGFKTSYTGSSTTLYIPGYTYDASTQKYYRVTKIAWGAFNPNIRTSFATQLRAITRVEIRPGVEELDAAVFYNCTSLNTVFLPSSIKKMGAYAFGACPIIIINMAAEVMPTFVDNLTFSEMGTVSGTRYFTCATPDGKTAADAVSHITSNFTTQWSHTAADFHSHVIGKSSEGTLCDVYLNVVTPVKASNPYQYYGKVKLLGANPSASNTSKTLKFSYNENMTFSNDYGNYYVTAIDKSFRYRATGLKVLDLSQTSKMETIESQALYGCTALTTANITAQTIGASAFYNCTGLTSLTLSERVKTLEGFAFAYTGMSTVTIPASLTSYGIGTFAYCSNLTKFNVASGNTYFATDSNTPNCLYNYSKTILHQMGAGTNPIPGALSAYMPNTLTTISTYAMAGTRLYTVDVPYGVKSIYPYAFSGMPNVQTIRIPSSVTTVWNNTFGGISSTTFKHLYINLNTIPSAMQTGSAFYGMASGVTLHVPLWRTGYYKGGSWWSGGWSSKFTGGVVEDAYDFTYTTFATGSYYDFILYYTVSSTSSYTDTKVQSAAANGQLTVVKATLGASGYFGGVINFPNTTEHRGKTYITTEVQREVFRNMTRIYKVTGGAGIKKIGALAFAGLTGCSGGFNIPYPVEFGDSALYNCKTPTITLGDRLQRIGQEAFRQTNITQLIMPNTVNYIGSRFVAGSSNLDTLRLSPNITNIPYQGLAGVNALYIVLPYGVKSIGSYAFVSDKFSIDDGETVAEIGGSNIVVIPSSVTSIDPNAFSCARHLEQIFLNCPYGVFTSVKSNWRRRMDLNASNAYDWSGHKLYVPVGQVQQYRNDPGIAAAWNEYSDVSAGAFDFTTGNDFMTTMYRMTVVNPTTKTAKYVYNWGTGSASINAVNSKTDHLTGITYTMVEIGDSCWANPNTVYKSVNFSVSSTITRIGAYAFQNCMGLNTEVSVPESVTEIGKNAFYGCTSLPSVFLNRSSGTTAVYPNLFSSSQQTILYVPLNRFYNIATQTVNWLANSASNRRLLPYVKPTTEWSAISVPVSDNILLPASGEFYYASSFNTGNYSLGKTQLSNSRGIRGGEGMLMKGTVGAIYRFRRNDAVSSYGYDSPTTNYLKGVTGANSKTLTYSSSGPYYYTFDGQKFNRVNSSATVYSGEAYVQLVSSYSNVYINSDITTYNLWINGIQVTEENCSNLKVINGVSGTTVSYSPTTNTLTLSGATITTTDAVPISCNISGLTIKVIGTNNVTVTTNNHIALQVMQNTTITGTGTLNASSAVTSGCMVYTGKTLTINGGVKVKFTGKIYGIYGYSSTSRLIISGASTKLTANGTTSGSYYQLPTTMNDGLAITSPTGAYFNNGTVIYGNSVAKNIDVVISKPAVTRGDVDGSGTVNISDVTSLIDYLLSGNASGINVSAADTDQSGSVNISDVTTLIDFLLAGHW